MKILIATSNPHKLDEIRAVIRDPAVELVSLDMVPGADKIEEPVEDQDTFESNAELKARYYAKATGMLCLADDSGLEVDALNGEPGVRSARYSNTDGPRAERDAANSRALMKNLGDAPIEKRTARFVCAMALVDGRESSGEVLAVVRGTLEGRILSVDEVDDPEHPERGRGSNGFGYDPIVYVPEHNKTVAELTGDEKNDISHRGCACVNLFAQMVILAADLKLQSDSQATSVKRDFTRDFLKDFMDAAIADQPKARQMLKDNPGLRDADITLGETALHYLAIEDQFEAVEFLAAEGFDVDTKNEFGDTPLVDAVSIGGVDSAGALLRHGADPNATSDTKDCVLFCAIRSGVPRLVELVLKNGASIDYDTGWGEKAIDIVGEAKDNSQEIERILREAMNKQSCG